MLNNFWTAYNRPTSWYELGHFLFPCTHCEVFFKAFTAYWNLRCEVDRLKDLTDISHELPPYKKVEHLPKNQMNNLLKG